MIREEASEPFRAERVPIFHRLGLGLGLRSRRFGDSDWRGGWNGMTKSPSGKKLSPLSRL
jgi:hypothetical protein